MKRVLVFTVVLLLGAACSVPGERPAATKKAVATPEKPADESHRFPKAERVKTEIVDNHLLGKDFLPGGNLAEYQRGKQTYRLFLIRTRSNDRAALLMFKFKGKLADAKFVPHMGGYFGHDGDQPTLLFCLERFLVGVMGLPLEQADPIAREFAARLR